MWSYIAASRIAEDGRTTGTPAFVSSQMATPFTDADAIDELDALDPSQVPSPSTDNEPADGGFYQQVPPS